MSIKKAIINSIVGLIVIFILFIAFLLYEYVHGIPSAVVNEFRRMQCNGICIAIDKGSADKRLSIKERNDTVYLGICSDQNEFWRYLELGDSVEKRKGVLKIKIKKLTGEVKEFEYPICLK